jgi:hypothetical protein
VRKHVLGDRRRDWAGFNHREQGDRKGSHLDTIHYEIDMLEYAFAKSKSALTPPELNMTIESFLLHYRNLIEFFSGAKHREKRI